jgi:hypothetical protein
LRLQTADIGMAIEDRPKLPTASITVVNRLIFAAEQIHIRHARQNRHTWYSDLCAG